MDSNVQHLRHADHADLAELYKREGPRLRAFVARLSGDPDVAEDLCHDTFLKALEGWSMRRLDGSARAWLYQIARHTVYDYLRQRAHFVSTPLCTTSLAVGCTSGDARDLSLALAELPPRTRAVLLLFGLGYRIQEIATLTGMRCGAVKSVMHRGRAHLRAQAIVPGES
jgi:RNA polymerase sigma-70 factor (ECF subfamily)